MLTIIATYALLAGASIFIFPLITKLAIVFYGKKLANKNSSTREDFIYFKKNKAYLFFSPKNILKTTLILVFPFYFMFYFPISIIIAASSAGLLSLGLSLVLIFIINVVYKLIKYHFFPYKKLIPLFQKEGSKASFENFCKTFNIETNLSPRPDKKNTGFLYRLNKVFSFINNLFSKVSRFFFQEKDHYPFYEVCEQIIISRNQLFKLDRGEWQLDLKGNIKFEDEEKEEKINKVEEKRKKKVQKVKQKIKCLFKKKEASQEAISKIKLIENVPSLLFDFASKGIQLNQLRYVTGPIAEGSNDIGRKYPDNLFELCCGTASMEAFLLIIYQYVFGNYPLDIEKAISIIEKSIGSVPLEEKEEEEEKEAPNNENKVKKRLLFRLKCMKSILEILKKYEENNSKRFSRPELGTHILKNFSSLVMNQTCFLRFTQMSVASHNGDWMENFYLLVYKDSNKKASETTKNFKQFIQEDFNFLILHAVLSNINTLPKKQANAFKRNLLSIINTLSENGKLVRFLKSLWSFIKDSECSEESKQLLFKNLIKPGLNKLQNNAHDDLKKEAVFIEMHLYHVLISPKKINRITEFGDDFKKACTNFFREYYQHYYYLKKNESSFQSLTAYLNDKKNVSSIDHDTLTKIHTEMNYWKEHENDKQFNKSCKIEMMGELDEKQLNEIYTNLNKNTGFEQLLIYEKEIRSQHSRKKNETNQSNIFQTNQNVNPVDTKILSSKERAVKLIDIWDNALSPTKASPQEPLLKKQLHLSELILFHLDIKEEVPLTPSNTSDPIISAPENVDESSNKMDYFLNCCQKQKKGVFKKPINEAIQNENDFKVADETGLITYLEMTQFLNWEEDRKEEKEAHDSFQYNLNSVLTVYDKIKKNQPILKEDYPTLLFTTFMFGKTLSTFKDQFEATFEAKPEFRKMVFQGNSPPPPFFDFIGMMANVDPSEHSQQLLDYVFEKGKKELHELSYDDLEQSFKRNKHRLSDEQKTIIIESWQKKFSLIDYLNKTSPKNWKESEMISFIKQDKKENDFSNLYPKLLFTPVLNAEEKKESEEETDGEIYNINTGGGYYPLQEEDEKEKTPLNYITLGKNSNELGTDPISLILLCIQKRFYILPHQLITMAKDSNSTDPLWHRAVINEILKIEDEGVRARYYSLFFPHFKKDQVKECLNSILDNNKLDKILVLYKFLMADNNAKTYTWNNPPNLIKKLTGYHCETPSYLQEKQNHGALLKLQSLVINSDLFNLIWESSISSTLAAPIETSKQIIEKYTYDHQIISHLLTPSLYFPLSGPEANGSHCFAQLKSLDLLISSLNYSLLELIHLHIKKNVRNATQKYQEYQTAAKVALKKLSETLFPLIKDYYQHTQTSHPMIVDYFNILFLISDVTYDEMMEQIKADKEKFHLSEEQIKAIKECWLKRHPFLNDTAQLCKKEEKTDIEEKTLIEQFGKEKETPDLIQKQLLSFFDAEAQELKDEKDKLKYDNDDNHNHNNSASPVLAYPNLNNQQNKEQNNDKKDIDNHFLTLCEKSPILLFIQKNYSQLLSKIVAFLLPDYDGKTCVVQWDEKLLEEVRQCCLSFDDSKESLPHLKWFFYTLHPENIEPIIKKTLNKKQHTRPTLLFYQYAMHAMESFQDHDEKEKEANKQKLPFQVIEMDNSKKRLSKTISYSYQDIFSSEINNDSTENRDVILNLIRSTLFNEPYSLNSVIEKQQEKELDSLLFKEFSFPMTGYHDKKVLYYSGTLIQFLMLTLSVNEIETILKYANCKEYNVTNPADLKINLDKSSSKKKGKKTKNNRPNIVSDALLLTKQLMENIKNDYPHLYQSNALSYCQLNSLFRNISYTELNDHFKQCPNISSDSKQKIKEDWLQKSPFWSEYKKLYSNFLNKQDVESLLIEQFKANPSIVDISSLLSDIANTAAFPKEGDVEEKEDTLSELIIDQSHLKFHPIKHFIELGFSQLLQVMVTYFIKSGEKIDNPDLFIEGLKKFENDNLLTDAHFYWLFPLLDEKTLSKFLYPKKKLCQEQPYQKKFIPLWFYQYALQDEKKIDNENESESENASSFCSFIVNASHQEMVCSNQSKNGSYHSIIPSTGIMDQKEEENSGKFFKRLKKGIIEKTLNRKQLEIKNLQHEIIKHALFDSKEATGLLKSTCQKLKAQKSNPNLLIELLTSRVYFDLSGTDQNGKRLYFQGSILEVLVLFKDIAVLSLIASTTLRNLAGKIKFDNVSKALQSEIQTLQKLLERLCSYSIFLDFKEVKHQLKAIDTLLSNSEKVDESSSRQKKPSFLATVKNKFSNNKNDGPDTSPTTDNSQGQVPKTYEVVINDTDKTDETDETGADIEGGDSFSYPKLIKKAGQDFFNKSKETMQNIQRNNKMGQYLNPHYNPVYPNLDSFALTDNQIACDPSPVEVVIPSAPKELLKNENKGGNNDQFVDIDLGPNVMPGKITYQ